MSILKEALANVKKHEIGEVLIDVIHRYQDLYPDWDIITLSLQKNGDRQVQINTIISALERLKTTP